MAPKRAKLFIGSEDKHCDEVREFIEGAGVLLQIRDLEADPLSEEELSQLIGHLRIDHFLNKLSGSFSRHKLDTEGHSREDVIKFMAEDPTLLRRPIVQSTRLITIGCDKRKIADMLQIDGNGRPDDAVPDIVGNRRNNNRRSGSSKKSAVSK